MNLEKDCVMKGGRVMGFLHLVVASQKYGKE